MTRTIVLCALVGALTVGCDGHTALEAMRRPTHRHSHDPDAIEVSATKANIDVPTDYFAAVERLREYTNAIKDAIATGANSKANWPLDEAEIVITEIMLIARDCRVPKGAWEEVYTAQQSLRASLEKLRAAIDAGEPPDLSAVSPAIESSLQHMEAVAAKLN